MSEATAMVAVIVGIVRAGQRQRCKSCGQRRVVYSVDVAPCQPSPAWPGGQTEYRCAECWGLTKPVDDIH
jgi:DNA-directed RNA polymerase subunit RPC12/RpoP